MKSALLIAILALPLAACGPEAPKGTPSPPAAKVFFIEPQDGAEVTSPFTVKFGIEGMDVAPAGDDKPNSGHHHLLIDSMIEDFSAPIPSDDKHVHFGKGQTETTLTLEPGQHSLQLILGDANHMPHSPPVQSEFLSVTVK